MEIKDHHHSNCFSNLIVTIVFVFYLWGAVAVGAYQWDATADFVQSLATGLIWPIFLIGLVIDIILK